MKAAKPSFLTSKQNLALNIAMDWLGESLINRTMADYKRIALLIPKLEAVHAYVNQKLREWAMQGYAPYQICYFKPGDQCPRYEPFPTSLSRETVRLALKNSGLWDLRAQA